MKINQDLFLDYGTEGEGFALRRFSGSPPQMVHFSYSEAREIASSINSIIPSPSPSEGEVAEALAWFEPRAKDGWHYNEKGAVLSAAYRSLLAELMEAQRKLDSADRTEEHLVDLHEKASDRIGQLLAEREGLLRVINKNVTDIDELRAEHKKLAGEIRGDVSHNCHDATLRYMRAEAELASLRADYDKTVQSLATTMQERVKMEGLLAVANTEISRLRDCEAECVKMEAVVEAAKKPQGQNMSQFVAWMERLNTALAAMGKEKI